MTSTHTICKTERVRCIRKTKSIPVYARTWDEFKDIILKHYQDFSVTFCKMKARINPFSVHRIKLHWIKI